MSHVLPDTRSTETPTRIERAARPAGIVILAVLHAIGGIVMLGVLGAVYLRWPESAIGMQEAGIPPALLVVGIIFLAGLGLTSAVGMWTGARWGWWAVGLYYFYSLFRNGWALYLVLTYLEADAGSRGIDYYIGKHGGRIAFHSLIILYLMRENVLAYFRLSQLNRLKATCILIGICVGVTAASSAAAWLMSE